MSWWRGDGDYADSIGANPLTSAGPVSFAPGEVGQGFDLTGAAGSYVQVANATSLDVTGPLTLEAWIDAAALGGRIFDRITAYSSDGYLLDTYGGVLRFNVGGDTLTSTSSLATGAWTHVAGVYDGSTLVVYINGVLAGAKSTAVAAVPVNTNPFHLGADSTSTSLFTGVIDEARVYNRALPAGEIKSIYLLGAAPRCH